MSQQSEVDLYCCPFCGASILKKELHDGMCFFVLSERLNGTNGQDVVLAQEVADAWKRRAVPEGFKLLSNVATSSELKRWDAQKDKYQRRANDSDVVGMSYAQIFEIKESVW